MNINNNMKSLLLIVIIFFSIGFLNHAYAASLDFDPTTSKVNVNDTISVIVKIDAGTEQIAGTDIYISYDDNLLDLQSVTGADYFPFVSNIPTTNRLYISGVVASQGDYKTGAGNIATLVFKSVANGTAELIFDCDLSQTDTSKIVKNDINASNIIDCSALGKHTVTIGTGSSSSNSTSSNTSAGDSPSSLPTSGAYDSVVQYVIYGGALLFFGIILRLLLRI